jgi:hypothetical protein
MLSFKKNPLSWQAEEDKKNISESFLGDGVQMRSIYVLGAFQEFTPALPAVISQGSTISKASHGKLTCKLEYGGQ